MSLIGTEFFREFTQSKDQEMYHWVVDKANNFVLALQRKLPNSHIIKGSPQMFGAELLVPITIDGQLYGIFTDGRTVWYGKQL